MKLKFDVKGLGKWNVWSESVIKEVEEEVKSLVKETSYKIERTAKQLAPVRTGHLVRNIKTRFNKGGLVGVVTSNAEYSIYVEYGTRKMAAQPYMTPAAFQHQDKFAEEVNRIIKKAGE